MMEMFPCFTPSSYLLSRRGAALETRLQMRRKTSARALELRWRCIMKEKETSFYYTAAHKGIFSLKMKKMYS